MAMVFAIVAFSFFLWPLALHELAPLRLDTLRVGAIADAGGGAAGGPPGKRRVHAARTIVTAQAARPSWRGLDLMDALPPGPLADLQTLPPSEPAISADLPAFSTPASAIASFNPRSSSSSGPDQGFPFLTTPGGPAPAPPIVSLPPVDPPISPPVTPPDNPVTTPDPSVPPAVVAPPIVAPFVAPPIGPGGPDPIKPFLPDPGGPGGGTQGGGPGAGVPEPAVWLELVLGAGLAGMSLRRARREAQPAMTLRARSRA
jgi:hypothetical protein